MPSSHVQSDSARSAPDTGQVIYHVYEESVDFHFGGYGGAQETELLETFWTFSEAKDFAEDYIEAQGDPTTSDEEDNEENAVGEDDSDESDENDGEEAEEDEFEEEEKRAYKNFVRKTTRGEDEKLTVWIERHAVPPRPAKPEGKTANAAKSSTKNDTTKAISKIYHVQLEEVESGVTGSGEQTNSHMSTWYTYEEAVAAAKRVIPDEIDGPDSDRWETYEAKEHGQNGLFEVIAQSDEGDYERVYITEEKAPPLPESMRSSVVPAAASGTTVLAPLPAHVYLIVEHDSEGKSDQQASKSKSKSKSKFRSQSRKQLQDQPQDQPIKLSAQNVYTSLFDANQAAAEIYDDQISRGSDATCQHRDSATECFKGERNADDAAVMAEGGASRWTVEVRKVNVIQPNAGVKSEKGSKRSAEGGDRHDQKQSEAKKQKTA